jgi:hypothetical protein
MAEKFGNKKLSIAEQNVLAARRSEKEKKLKHEIIEKVKEW